MSEEEKDFAFAEQFISSFEAEYKKVFKAHFKKSYKFIKDNPREAISWFMGLYLTAANIDQTAGWTDKEKMRNPQENAKYLGEAIGTFLGCTEVIILSNQEVTGKIPTLPHFMNYPSLSPSQVDKILSAVKVLVDVLKKFNKKELLNSLRKRILNIMLGKKGEITDEKKNLLLAIQYQFKE